VSLWVCPAHSVNGGLEQDASLLHNSSHVRCSPGHGASDEASAVGGCVTFTDLDSNFEKKCLEESWKPNEWRLCQATQSEDWQHFLSIDKLIQKAM